ncbi:MAG: AAA family ATPase [Candidatus Melainabacteria bacterium]|nr:AAA family ATPase [Candidatus Melainabacteria bacterium]
MMDFYNASSASGLEAYNGHGQAQAVLPTEVAPQNTDPNADLSLAQTLAQTGTQTETTDEAGEKTMLLSSQPAPGLSANKHGSSSQPMEHFVPPPPNSLEETGLDILFIEDMIFKLLLAQGVLSGKQISQHLCLPFRLLEPLLMDLKNRLYLVYRSRTGLGDFTYQLTDQGRERALAARDLSAYVGACPVTFDDYLVGMEHQSIRQERPNRQALEKAFQDLVLEPHVFDTLGPAINSGRGLFLYGLPGNGKTSIAERIGRCFKKHMYIPRTILVDGNLIQLYDPQNHHLHEPKPSDPPMPDSDSRWVAIQRPVIVVGGELTMEALEIKYNPLVRVCEAPLQLKANGGIFMIDDFGRQRINPDELLNRWIVPLEKRIDYLTLPTGRKIQVPFDELILFSTNLDPSQLVDEAFLRRIPYKIEIKNPDETIFRNLFKMVTRKYGVPYDEDMVTYLIENHYKAKNRAFRACHPRDIVEQVVNASTYLEQDPQMTPSLLDMACQNYFAALS